MLVLKKDMATSKNASSANSALWIIAFSLAIIAACLVALVGRQERQANSEATTPEIESVVEAPPAAAQPKPALPQIRPTTPRVQTAPAPEPQTVADIAPTTDTQVATVAASNPIVSGGLAPLTELAATNSIATIAGRVTLKGRPPPETPIPFTAQCGRLPAGANTTRRYVVSSDGGLANVFVYIKSGLKETRFPTPSEPVILNQTHCNYEPYVFGLMVNQKLRIKNSDSLLHNVHATTLAGNSGFNIAETPGAAIEKSFRTAEIPVRLTCDVHPWMFAYACVVENPYFAVTDANGNYSISNVPPGDYVLEAYHVKTHGRHDGETQRIAAMAGETATANFSIELSPINGRIAERR